MDIKITSIKPAPGAVQDAVGLIFGMLSKTPIGGVLPSILSGSGADSAGSRTFVNVTVVIVNDSNFGEVRTTAPAEANEASAEARPAAVQPAKKAAAKKAPAKKAVAAPAAAPAPAPAKRAPARARTVKAAG